MNDALVIGCLAFAIIFQVLGSFVDTRRINRLQDRIDKIEKDIHK